MTVPAECLILDTRERLRLKRLDSKAFFGYIYTGSIVVLKNRENKDINKKQITKVNFG